MKLAYRITRGMAFNYPCPRKLREIMKMSLIQREPAHTVQSIWEDYHQPRVNNTCSVLDKHKHSFISNRASSSPYFIIPVFRKGGHFKLLTQWQSDCFLCTFLQDFKRQGTNAQPYVVFTLFPQLLFQKGIVLVRGDIINNSLVKPQAQEVWKLLVRSYCQESLFELVHNFNQNQPNFSEQVYNESFGI